MAIIGIDLGTTNSLACVWQGGASVLIPNSFGEVLTPSVVSVDDDGAVLVGKIARERLVSHPEHTMASFKLFMGTGRSFPLGKRFFTPEELSAVVLTRLREDAERYLGEAVDEAVISVPAYFNDRQRAATKLAGQLAGLRVERLINEPSAAALAGRLHGDGGDESYLVFDCGGGTLDVSVVDCFDDVVEIVAVSGDNHLGGDDFDRIIADHFCHKNDLDFAVLPPGKQAILLAQARQCKHTLGTQSACMMALEEGGRILSATLTNEQLISLSAPLFGRISNVVSRALSDSRGVGGGVDKVVLVGGSCHMPIVRRFLAKLLRREPVELDSPDHIVAKGAGLCAGIKARQGDIRDVVLTDICPFTLGVNVVNHQQPDRPLMCPLIERNSTLPTSKVSRFCTAHDGQTALDIGIYQGEAMYCEDNLRLGGLRLPVPSAPMGEHHADVRFTYDINGILEVEVDSQSTGKSMREVLIGTGERMSEQAIAQRLKALAHLKRHPRDEDENRLTVARAERLFTQTTGAVREQIALRLDAFQAALSSQERYKIARARAQFDALLEQVEGELYTFGDFWSEGGE